MATKAVEGTAVKAKAKYDSDSIETLRFPDSIRSNPGMYIGGTDEHGRFVTLRELLDNGVDEFLAGRNDQIMVSIEADGSFIVQDNGGGIPQGIKTVEHNINGKIIKAKQPTMQAVFSELHTSGKFKSDAYKVSIGSHGVGVKGSNATAEFFHVSTCFKGKWYGIGFEKGVLKQPVAESKAPKSPFGKVVKGTLVHYKPDPKIFSAKSFPPTMLVEWSEMQSYLNAGLKITVSVKGKTKTFYSKDGAKGYITKQLEKDKATAEADMFEFKNELADAVIAFSNSDGFGVRGFTNGLPNSQGGKHVNSVANALYQAVKPYMTGIKKVEGKEVLPFTNNDFCDGMVGIVNAKLHKASFTSQDKAKLNDDRMGKDFEAMVFAEAKKFFSGNKAMAKRLCDRACKINELKGKFKASKAVATALNAVKKMGMPEAYASPARDVPIKDRELLIVEGESAAGGFREVRERNQGLLPLSGKIKNAWKAKGDSALLSRAIINILAAIGFDPKQADPMKKLQVGRVIFLADADPDGRHINCLLNGLIARYVPGMYEAGMVFVADMPEFYAIHKDSVYVGDTLNAVQAKLKKANVKCDVKHAKGWGEVDPEVLRILAVSSARRLIKIEPMSAEDLQTVRTLMSKDAPEAEVEGEAE